VDESVAASALQTGIFGPLDDHTGLRREEEHETAEGNLDEVDKGEPVADHDMTRKRHGDRRSSQLLNGTPAAKRLRLDKNELENGDDAEITTAAGASTGLRPEPAAEPATTAAADGTVVMDIDEQQQDQQHASQSDDHTDHHVPISQTDGITAYPSPMASDLAVIPTPHLPGLDKGTQLDRVDDLARTTTFLQLSTNGLSEAASPLCLEADQGPVLLHCEWSPRDPSSLATAGTDSLARVWTIAHATATTPGPDAVEGQIDDDVVKASRAVVQPAFRSMIPDAAPAQSLVTALTWNHDGSAIAIATEISGTASIHIWSSTGERLRQHAANEPPIVKLRWNPNNVGLLAITPDSHGTAITIFSGDVQLRHVLSSYDILRSPTALDATWTSESDFLVCGQDLLLALRCTASGIELLRKFELESGDRFVQVLFDHQSRLAATPTLDGNLVVSDWADQQVKNMCLLACLLTVGTGVSSGMTPAKDVPSQHTPALLRQHSGNHSSLTHRTMRGSLPRAVMTAPS